jgi:hypothetical protein
MEQMMEPLLAKMDANQTEMLGMMEAKRCRARPEYNNGTT